MDTSNNQPKSNKANCDELSGWRYYLIWKPGQRKYWKREYSRRKRKLGKFLLRQELTEVELNP